MIRFSRHSLANGLKIIYHPDEASPNVVLNILYDVGSKLEDPEKTGFAHLFEHLMFGGSANIPSYDGPLQAVGGQNNAFTSQDITNYYLTLPAANAETGFWLESDRMAALDFNPEVMEVQRKVVMEEFKQRYLNQPYGDFWLNLWPLTFTKHGYRWATIGKSLEHIERFTLDDVKAFFYNYYGPNNAILVIAGNIHEADALALAQKWFGDIPTINVQRPDLEAEPAQNAPQISIQYADVPVPAVYLAYHMVGRAHPDYYGTDLLVDMLGRGKTSYLVERLVDQEQIFSSLSAFVLGSIDPGLIVIEGKLSEDYTAEDGMAALEAAIQTFVQEYLMPERLEIAKNQALSTTEFNNVELLNRAMALAYHELLGDANTVNLEPERIAAVTLDQVKRLAGSLFAKANQSAILYVPQSDKVAS